jgi:hypothetical protein
MCGNAVKELPDREVAANGGTVLNIVLKHEVISP